VSELILLSHPLFGVLGILAGVWVLVDALNVTPETEGRVRSVSLLVAALIWLAYLFGGYWYVFSYTPEKAIILKGPWPFAHAFFMETKEHAFFMLLLLATFLPIAARDNLAASPGARRLVCWTAVLVIGLGLMMDGSGAFISMGVKLGLMPAAAPM